MGSNCVASTSIGCLFCCKGCNAEKVRNAFTFIPPQPSYEIVPALDDEGNEKLKMAYLLEGLASSQLYRLASEAAEVRELVTRTGSRIALVWLRQDKVLPRREQAQAADSEAAAEGASRPSGEKQEPIVLLHCHGNATDIGMMMGPYYELAKVLGIEVVGIEYSGYGSASGKPSSHNTYADTEAAYDYLIQQGVSPKRIVAYGQSVGSGPVSSLASKKTLGGIVLHSPLLSGIKVVDPKPDSCCRPSCIWSCFDFYPNDRRIKTLTCPVFIMHGQRDDIIPFYHGYRLHKSCPKQVRWPGYFPARASHNDLVETDMRAYFGELSSFLYDVKRIAQGQRVEPPSPEKPQQVQMIVKTVVREPQEASKDAALEVNGQPEYPQSGKGDDFIGHVAEPKAGPEDGRYEQLRKGNIAVPGGLAFGTNGASPGAESTAGAVEKAAAD
eukprot:TRINITY_DN15924_c0_g1_i1.p1 TRINITY_DN15924_c0_g1~~TRINITY_DN15924_c0_g1_i1.p1  ORF type:complete len:441 (+),score=73.75 TRINITY_DN15924_c0_g1_i1:76-1398(+)